MEQTKLNIAATLKQAFVLYRQNFGALLKFSLVSFLCSLPAVIGGYILKMGRMGVFAQMEALEQIPSFMEMMLPSFLVMLVSQAVQYTIGAKNELGVQFYLADITAAGEGEKPTLKSAYAQTKGRVASLAGNQFILSLIGSVVFGSFTVLFNVLVMQKDSDQRLATDIFMSVLSLVSGLVYPWSLLLKPAAAFGEKSRSKLGLVSRMFKGSFWRVLVVAFAGKAISTIYSEITRFVSVNSYVNTSIRTVIFLFVFGFYSAAAFAAYQALNAKPEPEEASAIEEDCENTAEHDPA